MSDETKDEKSTNVDAVQCQPAYCKTDVSCIPFVIPKYDEFKNEILSLGFTEVTANEKETEFVIDDGFSQGSYYKVSLFKDDVSCPVFIRSHKSENDYGEVVAGYHLVNKGDFTELLARLVGWFKFIDKVSDCFKVIAK